MPFRDLQFRIPTKPGLRRFRPPGYSISNDERQGVGAESSVRRTIMEVKIKVFDTKTVNKISFPVEDSADAVSDFALCERIIENVSRVVVGKRQVIELLLVALLADGHVLLDDVPGLGKTLMAKSLARSIGGSFRRVQFTPDLLPADITGFTIYDQQAGLFTFQPGPVITNILLADEINRTIPRTQSSLLESMEEKQVTVDGRTYSLPHPFFGSSGSCVLAVFQMSHFFRHSGPAGSAG